MACFQVKLDDFLEYDGGIIVFAL